MKEYKLEDIMPVKAIELQVWNLFSVLRKNRMDYEHFHIIPLFISLYKDDRISEDALSGITHSDFEVFHILSNTNTSEATHDYSKIIEIFHPSLVNIRNRSLHEFIEKLFQIDKTILKENFSEIFDFTLDKVVQAQGRFSGEFLQPIELTRVICAIADLPENSRVFNPFAGFASFAVFLNKGEDYLGQELNQKTWALGALRIMAYDRPGMSKYVCDDSILNWPNEVEKFDLVVANPPYGMRLGNQYQDILLGDSVEEYLIKKGVDSLKSDGKLIALLPVGFLFRGGSELELRRSLIEKDLVDTLIYLPRGLIFNIGISLVILVIDKNKKNSGKVRFIDATKFVESKNSKEKKLNDYALNGVFSGSNKNSDLVRIVDNQKIIEFDYNLNVLRYFQKDIEGVRLGVLLEIIRGRRNQLPDNGKLIRIRDLKNDKVDFTLDVSNIEASEGPKSQLRLIDETCLLLAVSWNTLKPTLFKFSDTPIFLPIDILAFKINEEKVDIAYLINELHADYVQEQLKNYRLEGAVPRIIKEDLLNIIIKLPSLEEQKVEVRVLAELSRDIEALIKEQHSVQSDVEVSKYNEFASLKHTLGRPRQNILDWTDNLIHFLNVERSGIEELNKAFLEFYETDIFSALKEIKRDINFMTEVLEKGENGFMVEDFEKTIIPLSDINSLINNLSSNNFNFRIEKLLLKGERLKDRGISGNRVLLKTLIDNVLTNAHKYGFQNKEHGNEVVFELMEIEDNLSLEIRNNGNSFPKNFDREKFITKYSTADSKSGTGLGGYDIHRIATEFLNPDWELILNEDPIYPVKFNFQFPIKLIN